MNSFEDVLLGKELGRGGSRTVYECKVNSDLVVKVAVFPKMFANVTEWLTWEKYKDTEWGHYLAPCVSISSDGAVLLQMRTFPTTDYPTRIPSFIDDVAPSNWGLFQDRVVCHDYSIIKSNPVTLIDVNFKA